MPKFKTSENKSTLPFRKQIYRYSRHGDFVGDEVRSWDEGFSANGDKYIPLLKPYIENGRLVADLPALEQSREIVRQQLSRLPENYRSLEIARDYPVEFSFRLTEALTKSTQ